MEDNRMTTILLQYGARFNTSDAYDNIKKALENNEPFVYFVDEFGNNCIVRCDDIIAAFQYKVAPEENEQNSNN